MKTIGLLLFASIAFAQAVEFEVATIRPAAPPREPGRTSSRMSVDTGAGQLVYTNVTLRDVISRAFKVHTYQVIGPSWLETERFDFAAKFAPESEQVPAMLLALLTERFHLAIHRETKDLPAYALIANMPKLKPTGSTGDNLSTNGTRTSNRIEAKATMSALAEYLSQRLDRPVLDQTGLSGRFEFTLEWSVDDSAGTNSAVTGPSIFTAIQEQLGLKLNATKGPVETIVVDRIDKTPTEN